MKATEKVSGQRARDAVHRLWHPSPAYPALPIHTERLFLFIQSSERSEDVIVRLTEALGKIVELKTCSSLADHACVEAMKDIARDALAKEQGEA